MLRVLRWGSIAVLALGMAAPASVVASPRPAASRLVRQPDAITRLFGAQATGAGNAVFAQIETGSRHEGYRWRAVAFKEGPGARTELVLEFARSAAQDTQHQSSQFSWTLSPGALEVGRRLKPATLRTRAGMGSNGSIAMGLASPGRYLRTSLEGCSGWVEYRVAKLEGRLRVHLRDLYFGRVAADRATVFLYRAHDLRCEGEPPPPPCPDHLSLFATDPETGVELGVSRTEEGRVDQRVELSGRSGDADAVHHISVQVAVPEAFEASEDLTSARVDGDVGGPWLSGDLSYLAPPPPSDATDDCGPHQTTSGVITGDFTAHFDSAGDVTPAGTGTSAILRRETS